ncbi:glycoside hydrolase family 2 protein [Lophiostoma macrostomum CBS 122681]|uniref:Beta-mannosidase n=1 Tax=Lophiostoma macrostomum CBS 122681 TaxID=1314788 RepID=A0A6A6T7L0_9PLEO|nr:glycoside hydrolase family 2 protein [Lophiostoma macrostomum CBS 122681]
MAPHTAHETIPLDSGWEFKQGNRDSKNEYLPANNVPTEVHRDLLKNGKIADPFIDLNELSVRWIADETWTYRTSFTTPDHYSADTRAEQKTVLRFEGLDTFASVYLNGQPILESDNMLIEHRVDVAGKLYARDDKNGINKENELEIVFESARKRGLKLVEDHPEHRFIVHQTEVTRGPVRKAQYHWGWDWGPLLLTAGPWRPISLETYVARIEDVWLEYHLSDDLARATGKAWVKTPGSVDDVTIQIRKISSPKEKLGVTENAVIDFQGQCVQGIAEYEFDIPVELWWPSGYGEQTLYVLEAQVQPKSPDNASGGNFASHRVSKTVGFRKTELIQEQDDIGTSFYFRINNTDIFAGGSCWIPTDSFLSQVTPERYRDWIKLADEGNQAMIRVWGGGIYEPNAFYDACDKLGILVWQDFMFACANYPAYPAYLASVEEEARQNVRRLRNHPSIVIWAGNNEDYQIVERYGLEYRYEEDKDPQSWLKTDFPARYIYEYLLPKVISEETKGVPYHPSSPFGNGKSSVLKVDPTVGDVHQWNVWHGEMKPYQLLPHMGGRFVSEFGMEAYPHLSTLEKCVTEDKDRYPGSMAMDFRNKAIGHERRLVSYVAENFRIRYDLPNFTHLTQVMQSDAITWAYKSWRRQWGTKGKRQCGGVLVWQLNDCWPTMSWAVVDYYLTPKPAYYAIKRSMQPIVVGVTRKFNDWTMRHADDLWKRDTSHIDMRQVWTDVEFDAWVASSKTESLRGKLELKTFSIASGQEGSWRREFDVAVEPNGTTEVVKGCKIEPPTPSDPDSPFKPSKADPFVIYAVLTIGGQAIATDVSWPDPIKYLDFSDRGVAVEYSDSNSSITVTVSKPVKGFVFEEKERVRLSDNGFDLVPGESKEVYIDSALEGTYAPEYRYVGI